MNDDELSFAIINECKSRHVWRLAHAIACLLRPGLHILLQSSQVYAEPSQTTNIEHFVQIVSSFELLTVLQKAPS